MSQNEKHMQIFSLKSNLIPNCKGVSYGLTNHKNSQQIRMKSVCFSTMLNSIRNQAGKDKGKQKERQSIDLQKQNNAIAISANKYNAVQSNAKNNVATISNSNIYGHDTPLVAQPPRLSIPQSKSFLIRAHNRKPTTSNLQLKKQEVKKAQKLQIPFQVILKCYNFCSAKQISYPVSIIPCKNWKQREESSNECLSIIVPVSLFQYQNFGHVGAMFEGLVNKGISIFVLVMGKQKAEKLHKNYQQYCHIIYLQSEQKSNHTKQYFINCTSIKQYISTNILVFQNLSLNKDNIMYFPYFQPQCQDKLKSIQFYNAIQLFEQKQVQKQVKIGFVKIDNINKIKSLQLQKQFVVVTAHNFIKKPRLSQFQKSLKITVKLQLQTKYRYTTSTQHHSNNPIPTCQSMQQKLLQYSKILKKQQQQKQKQKSSNSKQIVNISSNCIDLKSKQHGRRSLTSNSKSAYQIINQLIRNNNNIQKQIGQYYNQSKNVNIREKIVQCDDVCYYCVQ